MLLQRQDVEAGGLMSYFADHRELWRRVAAQVDRCFEALTQAHRALIADLAAKGRLPAIYGGREFVEARGLRASLTSTVGQRPMLKEY